MPEKPYQHNIFSDTIANHSVVVCVGSGGVGKTTTSAVIGLHAALQGRKVLVLTIDPARRLANSLGIEELGHEIQQISLEQFQQDESTATGGELWAMMLDMKRSFDDVVKQYAPDENTRQAILDNRFYQYFSTSLAGTQEYAASERLYQLYTEGKFDLIVLDTPPTTHALDFLEAPNRLADAVSSKALHWLYRPGLFSGRSGAGIFSTGSSYIIKTLSRFTGGELLQELAVFLRTFSTLFEGFESRAREVKALLTSRSTTFIVVTAPDALTVDEALYFYEQLGAASVQIGAFAINKVHPQWISEEICEIEDDELIRLLERKSLEWNMPVDDIRSLATKLITNANQFMVRAQQDDNSLMRLNDEVPRNTPVVTVPFFNQDIHSLEGLNQARRALFF